MPSQASKVITKVKFYQHREIKIMGKVFMSWISSFVFIEVSISQSILIWIDKPFHMFWPFMLNNDRGFIFWIITFYWFNRFKTEFFQLMGHSFIFFITFLFLFLQLVRLKMPIPDFWIFFGDTVAGIHRLVESRGNTFLSKLFSLLCFSVFR